MSGLRFTELMQAPVPVVVPATKVTAKAITAVRRRATLPMTAAIAEVIDGLRRLGRSTKLLLANARANKGWPEAVDPWLPVP